MRGDGKQGRFDDIIGWGFQLLAWERNPGELLSGEQADFLARIGGHAAGLSDREAPGLLRDEDGVYRRYFDAHNIAALLMRPDFVVFGVVQSVAELPRLVEALRGALALPSDSSAVSC